MADAPDPGMVRPPAQGAADCRRLDPEAARPAGRPGQHHPQEVGNGLGVADLAQVLALCAALGVGIDAFAQKPAFFPAEKPRLGRPRKPSLSAQPAVDGPPDELSGERRKGG